MLLVVVLYIPIRFAIYLCSIGHQNVFLMLYLLLLAQYFYYLCFSSSQCVVKPGMTGLWQISPDRHRCYEERIPLDMQYIDACSLFLDIAILFKTLKVCIFPTGV